MLGWCLRVMDGLYLCNYCFIRRCHVWQFVVPLLGEYLVILQSGGPFLEVRALEVFIRACFQR